MGKGNGEGGKGERPHFFIVSELIQEDVETKSTKKTGENVRNLFDFLQPTNRKYNNLPFSKKLSSLFLKKEGNTTRLKQYCIWKQLETSD